LRNWKRGKTFFLEAIQLFDHVQRGDPHWLSIQFMKSQHVDRVAAARLLESFEDTFMDWLQAFTMPTLVVCGSEDEDNGSAEELAGALPNGIFEQVPGTHMSSVTKPEFGIAIADFLGA
jgi:pimeloyl-ACP methyl ester carboxylesterase